MTAWMPPLVELEPTRLFAAVALVVVLTAFAGYALGWHERRRVELERRHRAGLRDWRSRYWREEP